MTGYGTWHHPVSTKNAQAQAFFDQGLRLIYAFNHDEAMRSFQRAATRSETGHGVLGHGRSSGAQLQRSRQRRPFCQAHALLRKRGRSLPMLPRATAYIAALAKRFPADPKSDLHAAAEQYRDAMREVVKRFQTISMPPRCSPSRNEPASLGCARGRHAERHGGNCLDAGVRDSPRAQSSRRGSLLIHSVEASHRRKRFGGRESLAELALRGTHRAHAAHIYIRTGDYEVRENHQKAALADQAYIKAAQPKASIHDVLQPICIFIACPAMNGNYLESRRGAQMLAANVGPHVKEMPLLEGFMTVPLPLKCAFTSGTKF